jgi:hypothetical protein
MIWRWVVKESKRTSDQLVTSFSSKSNVALKLSADDRYLTFNGYVAHADTINASNSNTPLALDPPLVFVPRTAAFPGKLSTVPSQWPDGIP